MIEAGSIDYLGTDIGDWVNGLASACTETNESYYRVSGGNWLNDDGAEAFMAAGVAQRISSWMERPCTFEASPLRIASTDRLRYIARTSQLVLDRQPFGPRAKIDLAVWSHAIEEDEERFPVGAIELKRAGQTASVLLACKRDLIRMIWICGAAKAKFRSAFVGFIGEQAKPKPKNGHNFQTTQSALQRLLSEDLLVEARRLGVTITRATEEQPRCYDGPIKRWTHSGEGWQYAPYVVGFENSQELR